MGDILYELSFDVLSHASHRGGQGSDRVLSNIEAVYLKNSERKSRSRVVRTAAPTSDARLNGSLTV